MCSETLSRSVRSASFSPLCAIAPIPLFIPSSFFLPFRRRRMRHLHVSNFPVTFPHFRPPSLPRSVRAFAVHLMSRLSLSRCRGFGRISEAPRHAHRSTMIVRKGGSTTLAVAAAVILIAGVSQSSQPDTLDLKAFVLPFQRCENNCI